MSFSNDLLRSMKCCLNIDNHIVHEPILLDCGCNACKKCINDIQGSYAKCLKCNRLHEAAKFQNVPLNFEIEGLIQQKYFKDLIGYLKDNFVKRVDELKDDVLTDDIEYRMDIIKNDIDIRIESLINELHQLRDELKGELDELKEKFQEFVLKINKKNLLKID
jgi:hypothetical protein